MEPMQKRQEFDLPSLGQEGQKFKKVLKIDDDMDLENNKITIFETPNMKMGTGTRIWESVGIFGLFFLRKSQQQMRKASFRMRR